MQAEREDLIRQYAAGEVAWSSMQGRLGFETYMDVLAALGELGLRPPMAPMAGPNLKARLRGRAILRERLSRQDKS